MNIVLVILGYLAVLYVVIPLVVLGFFYFLITLLNSFYAREFEQWRLESPAITIITQGAQYPCVLESLAQGVGAGVRGLLIASWQWVFLPLYFLPQTFCFQRGGIMAMSGIKAFAKSLKCKILRKNIARFFS